MLLMMHTTSTCPFLFYFFLFWDIWACKHLMKSPHMILTQQHPLCVLVFYMLDYMHLHGYIYVMLLHVCLLFNYLYLIGHYQFNIILHYIWCNYQNSQTISNLLKFNHKLSICYRIYPDCYSRRRNVSVAC